MYLRHLAGSQNTRYRTTVLFFHYLSTRIVTTVTFSRPAIKRAVVENGYLYTKDTSYRYNNYYRTRTSRWNSLYVVYTRIILLYNISLFNR